MRFVISRLLWKTGLLKFVRMTTRFRGAQFRVSPSSMGTGIWVDPERYEKGALAALLAALKPGDVFVDVGANIGVFAVLGAKAVGSGGRVVAVEPHPRTFDFLTENVSLNHLLNVTLVNCAVGSGTGTAHLSDRHSDDQNAVTSAGGIEVPLARLDDVLDGFGDIDVLKIDVEGFELEVLRGARSVLARTRIVLIELWSDDVPAELGGFEIQEVSRSNHMRDLLCVRR